MLNYSVAELRIIVAYSKDVTKPSDNTLNLTFQHILTRINFAVKLVDSSYTYTVESITVTGAKGGTATYTFGDNGKLFGAITSKDVAGLIKKPDNLPKEKQGGPAFYILNNLII